MINKPLVSICCLTYNHVNYINQCLNGFLMQQCDFEYEILIHDDASTDGTSDIIREYQKKYPEIIKPIIQTENQYSKGIGVNRVYNFPRAKGKYIALCEGDDFWTDPLKLQKQVDFLETNPEYSLVCGGFKSVNTITGEEEIIIKDIENAPDNTAKGFDITIERFFKQWLTKTLTLVYRTELYNPNDFKDYKYTKDVHLNYHLLKRGKGYYMKEVFGVYHIHQGGVFSSTDTDNRINNAYLIYHEISMLNRTDKLAKNKRNNYGKSVLRRKGYREDRRLMPFKLLMEQFLNMKSVYDLKTNIKLTLQVLYLWK
jgi:glycosyltransferase involved in cell wall biosynthesis